MVLFESQKINVDLTPFIVSLPQSLPSLIDEINVALTPIS